MTDDRGSNTNDFDEIAARAKAVPGWDWEVSFRELVGNSGSEKNVLLHSGVRTIR